MIQSNHKMENYALALKKTFNSQTSFYVAAALLFLLACFLHFYRLGGLPPGLFVDECAIGYNAYCIAETGADEYGIRLPMFFRCFDNYHEPVMVYFLAPLVKAFGLTKFVVRFPGAFFCILASIAFFFLARKLCGNKWIALAGAFVFSVLPWIFPLSRSTMAGYMPMLLGICAGWYFMMKAFGGRSFIFSVFSALGWAFAMYSHNCARPMTAVMLVCFVAAFNILLIKRWKIFLTFCCSFFLFMLPMILYAFWRPEFMTSRFNQICVWGDSPATGELIKRIVVRYIGYFSPSFLFVSGDSNLRHNIGVSGELYLFMIPFVAIGIYRAFKNFRKNPWSRFLLYCIFTYPLAAILTMGTMHATRSLNGAPFWCAFAVLGADVTWRKRARLYPLLIIIMCLAPVEALSYFSDYFYTYPYVARIPFRSALCDSLQYAFNSMKPGDKLYVSATALPQRVDREFRPFWYSYFLFFGKIPPADFYKNGLSGKVIPYEGRISGGGILVRINPLILRTRFRTLIVPNMERIPKGSRLLARTMLVPDVYYEILRVPDESEK